ncbi:MAG: carbohydrate kinase [Hyphomicrobiales bacterium]
MFLSCGDALFDLFAGGSDHPAVIQLDGRAGGAPMNVAIGLSRLGQKVDFFSKVSRDIFGERIMAHLANEGVETGLIIRTEQLSTLAIVSLDSAGAARYSFYIENTADRSISEIELPAALPNEIKVIHIGGSYSTALEPSASSYAALVARERDRRLICYDPNIRDSVAPDLDLWRARVATLASMAHLIKASEEDLAKLFPGRSAQSVARDWIAGGASLVLITLGGEGALGFTANGLAARVPGIKVKVIDTVGAGDTFQAATLDWLARKNRLSPEALASLTSQELHAMLTYAAKAAAITCSRRGADLPRASELAGEFA